MNNVKSPQFYMCSILLLSLKSICGQYFFSQVSFYFTIFIHIFDHKN